MEKQDLIFSFSALREAYVEVKNFLEEETLGKIKSLSTTIQGDLGCTGDDSYELLVKFTDQYNLGHDGFDYSAHFLYETELVPNVVVMIVDLCLLPLHLLNFFLKRKINLVFLPKWFYGRETADLTFGDMVSWYLVKDFNQRSGISIKLPVST